MEYPKPSFREQPADNSNERINKVLRSYPGLYEALHGWCSNNGYEEASPITMPEVAKILADSREARNAAKEYLREGEGPDLDVDVARSLERELAWAIVDVLAP
jgi:hypothetical protein